MPSTLLCLTATLVQTRSNTSVPPINGPAVVVMLKDGCPCTKECHGELNALAAACRGKIRFVGLLDGDARKASALVKEAALDFPVLSDPKLARIRSLKGHEGLDLRIIGAEGKIVGSWNAISRDNVASLVAAVRSRTGKDVSLDLDPFTKLSKVGCSFDL